MKYEIGKTVYHLNILYNEGFIISYIIGEYKVIGIVDNTQDNPLYILKGVNHPEDAPDYKENECNLFGSKKEVYEYLLEDYETDLERLRNKYKKKEEYMVDDIKELKKLIKKEN